MNDEQTPHCFLVISMTRNHSTLCFFTKTQKEAEDYVEVLKSNYPIDPKPEYGFGWATITPLYNRSYTDYPCAEIKWTAPIQTA